MKNLYLFILLLFFSATSAQNINITDANFKTVLLSADVGNNIAQNAANQNFKIDANGDGEIQQSEASAVKKLKLISNGTPEMSAIVDIQGIENFNGLDSLKIRYLPQIQTVNVNGMTNLKSVWIYSCNQLVNTNFQGCTGLLIADITSNNSLTALSFQNLPVLNYIDVNQNNLVTLSVNGCTALTDLNASYNHVLSLNLSNLSNLETVNLNHNNLTTVTLLNNTALQSLDVGQNSLQNLSLAQALQLNYLSIEYNQFSTIDLTFSTQLVDFYCGHNQFVTLDLSAQSNLEFFNFGNNPNLKYIFMKNGKNNFIYGNQSAFAYNPSLLYICGDDEELSAIGNSLTSFNQNNVAYSSYCTFTPGGTFHTIEGNTRYDANANGCDNGDVLNNFQKYAISGSSVLSAIFTNGNSNYSIPVQEGSHTITPTLENPSYFLVSPSSATINFPPQTSPQTQNFCLTANGNHNDLEITIVPITSARPGFLAFYKILFRNKGTSTQSGTLNFNYNDDLMDYSTATIAPSSQSFGVLNYNFTNILPFKTSEIIVTFILNTPAMVPPLAGGQILNYYAQINGLTDETPGDNTFSLLHKVINSFDPNDKICSEGTSISQAQVGDYVHYVIRFENTGTAAAENVVIKDLIDQTKYDINSLIVQDASHDLKTRVSDPNTIEFIFENIQLPFDPNYNNKGFVAFKIKTLSTLVSGDAFSNNASIYFDYNLPIVTDTYTTTVASILGSQETTSVEGFNFYPNPVEDIIHFKTRETLIKLEIYDIAGRIVVSTAINNNVANVSFLKTGNYFIKVFTKDKQFTNKLIKK